MKHIKYMVVGSLAVFFAMLVVVVLCFLPLLIISHPQYAALGAMLTLAYLFGKDVLE